MKRFLRYPFLIFALFLAQTLVGRAQDFYPLMSHASGELTRAQLSMWLKDHSSRLQKQW